MRSKKTTFFIILLLMAVSVFIIASAGSQLRAGRRELYKKLGLEPDDSVK